MNLLNASASDLNASGTGKASASGTTGVTSFLTLLGLATTGNSNKDASNTVGQKKTGLSTGALGAIFPALTTSEMKGLLETLEAMAGTTTGSTSEKTESLPGQGSGINDGTATGSSTTPEQQVENLILTLLALVVAKIGSNNGSKPGEATAGRDRGHGTGKQRERRLTGHRGEHESRQQRRRGRVVLPPKGQPVQRDQETLETLALLIFHSLQAVLQGQNPVEPTAGDGADGAFSSDETVCR